MQTRYARGSTVARPVPPAGPESERPDEKPVQFTLNMPKAKSVTVAGSFNAWDTKKTPLRKESNSGWKTTVWLPPGRYEYRFVIDGTQWLTDPNAKEAVDNGMGSSNSVLVV
jgi:1,4-alpha-glucan branching enzyme